MTCQSKSLLKIDDLSITFRRYKKGLREDSLEVIKDLSVSVGYSEMVAVVGASGSGKSLLAHALFGILPSNCQARGHIYLNGKALTAKSIESVRGKEMVLVPQSLTYLDPLEKVGPQVRRERNDEDSRRRQEELFRYYGLEKKTAGLYPFELSGGMARRVLLSAAMMESPRLIVADEPTPGLHIEAAKKALRHFREFADAGNGVLLITHDLELAIEMADKIAVFYAGTTVEVASAKDFASYGSLRHPYTKALWMALPQNGFAPYPGNQPQSGEMPCGCPFGPRCQSFESRCAAHVPTREVRDGLVRCHQAS
jgi:peptide/nickel transport system ATP-binding protein